MIHKLADGQATKIGENTNIWQFCVVLKGAEIGHNCNINADVLIENDVIIGDNVTVKSDVQLWNGNPAKHRGYVCKSGQKCDETLICSNCEMEGVNSCVCLMVA